MSEDAKIKTCGGVHLAFSEIIYVYLQRAKQLLCSEVKAKRHKEFERQLNDLDEESELAGILKLIFAYSEDLPLSKRVDTAILKNTSLVKLAKWAHAVSNSVVVREHARRPL